MSRPNFLSEVRSVQGQTHGDTSNKASNWDRHDLDGPVSYVLLLSALFCGSTYPAEDEETDTLPVDGLERAVAETDTNGGTSDAHASGNGELNV
jgi:hypothetical protein